MRAAARSEIMPHFRRLDTDAVRAKTGPCDLVTVADEAAETVISEGLRRLHPGAAVVGEEAASADRSLLERLVDADLAFTVDPIDGTSNFAAGVPMFGVMVSALVRGEVVGAVIHDPVCDDAMMALRGEGAWLERPDGDRVDLRVAPPVSPDAMTGNASWRHLPPTLRDRVALSLPRVLASWDYRCAAHEYRMLASGHCHFLLFNGLMPWDHLPGWLLHSEAGGYGAHFDGSPFRPGTLDGGLLYAPDRDSWLALREVLFGDAV
ncbi:inositol monophosphatase family protein [Rhizosaccharibacter radicis]|uniref:Inositol monophosphatase n=1 Tax=Rhizosaccharibacter radicis TaxID=2782605 RepID=A0ABT1VYN3_9PROT|nr:inositol monophosphatase [Acetobacteraceae bacterium KSS12]